MFSAATKSASPATAATYIEDVFSTYLYTGAYTAPVYTQTITNGIDLSGKGGLVWLKDRGAVGSHRLCDTARGALSTLFSDSTSAAVSRTSPSDDVDSFSSTGFVAGNFMNQNGNNYASWTFRKQPKFFDVVTYTGDGVSTRTVSHSLGSVPGCIIIKTLNEATNWIVWHRGNGTTNYNALSLNTTDSSSASVASGDLPTSTVFTPSAFYGSDYLDGNRSGKTYVAYLFAHDAGGFGLTGTDNVISCGSFTTDSSGNGSVTLGYEPQFVLLKATSEAGDWYIEDNMRGWQVSGNNKFLLPNTSGAEANYGDTGAPNATGFTVKGLTAAAGTMIYIAIRRGPMKTPTSGTSVFAATTSSGGTGTALTTNFPVDMQMLSDRAGYINAVNLVDRLRGVSTTTTEVGNRLLTAATTAENSAALPSRFWNNTGFQMPSTWAGGSNVFWSFGRAPGFFDEVCYTGTGSQLNVTHNLGVTPELIIIKARNNTTYWPVLPTSLGNNGSYPNYVYLNDVDAKNNGALSVFPASPTSTQFTVGTSAVVNYNSSTNYVAYLFATCPGVSKVGSYTGTGTTKQIDCGFTGGARFVLVKATSTTGDWLVWDSARGIVAGNDPYLALNSTAAEVTTTDWVDTYSAGFELSNASGNLANTNGTSYIFLAVS